MENKIKGTGFRLLRYYKIFILFLILASIASCSTLKVSPPIYQVDDLRLFAIEKFSKTVYVHLDIKKDIKTGSNIEIGLPLGEVAPKPVLLSTKYHNIILKSQKLYNNGQYESAARSLEIPYKEEPRNIFILESYARALYWKDREASFIVYQKLIKILDGTAKRQENEVVIDLWFPEAYWKIATLYLDQNNYEQAAFEICRALLTIYSLGEYDPIPGDKFYIQLFQYLTEAHFHLKQFSFARYYAQKTLELDSHNDYAREILTLTSS